MKHEHAKQLMIGLPGTGKTTFIAALWNIVESGEIPSSLKLAFLHGNRDYLNAIRNKWLNCKPLERTVIGSEKTVSMLLEDSETGITTEIVIPDLSGESYNVQWKYRKWTKEYSDLANEASGALLFVHPRELRDSIKIDPAISSLLSEFDQEDNCPSDSVEPDQIKPFDLDNVPTQVKLVELLQFLTYSNSFHARFKIAIIISAWDCVAEENLCPRDWISRHLPLLDQYLTSNEALFSTRFLGVSAQGGDLKQDSDRLRRMLKPSERVLIVDESNQGHDVTEPIKWLLRA